MTTKTKIIVSCPKKNQEVDLDTVCWECPNYEGLNYNAEVVCNSDKE